MASTIFAYDGSTHGDWVGRYAVRVARARGERLLVLHVARGEVDRDAVEARLQRLRSEASDLKIEVQFAPGSGRDVATVLDGVCREEPSAIVLTGLRARESGRGLLSGTVSERLLRAARHNVLAVRVVSPGLLGQARHVLYALSQNPRSARRAGLFLQGLAPQMTRLSLLSVFPPRLGSLARPTESDLQARRERGMAYLWRVQAELRAHIELSSIPVDPHVSVSADWPAEIVRHASRVRAQLLLVGATERSLPRRLMFGNPLERVLHETVCDVAIFRRAERSR